MRRMAKSESALRDKESRQLMAGVEMLGGMAGTEVTRHDEECKHRM